MRVRLRHSSPHEQTCRWIRVEVLIRRQISGSGRALWVLELVLHQQVGHDDLDLVGGEESAGAGVFSVAKVETVVVGHGELVLVGLRWVHTLLVVAESIELVGVGLVLGVLEDRGGGHAKVGSPGKNCAIGEGQILRNNAVKSHCSLR